MNVTVRQHLVETSRGSIAVEEVGQGELPVIFIHGNSFCRGVFRHQMNGRLAKSHRLIAFDLPGHGDSSNAPHPVETYTRPGLASAIVELLQKLEVSEAVVVGWSLGGHIGLEMLSLFSGVRGMMITGTPPVGRNNMAEGFMGSPQLGTAGRQDLTREDIEKFVLAVLGENAEPSFFDAVARADGRFRKRLFEAARAGVGVDQRAMVESSLVPLAVVNGASDRIVNLDYVDTPAYANLWDDRCHRLTGVGHAPFWQAPDAFDSLLERFLGDIESGRATHKTAAGRGNFQTSSLLGDAK